MNRETWLNELANLMAPRFAAMGFPIPAFRVSLGFTSKGASNVVAAECWHAKNSADGRFEIFISPREDRPTFIACHLAHELTHAAVGFKEGHKGKFSQVMRALGVGGPMTATVPAPDFDAWAVPLIESLPPLPHAKLSWGAMAAKAPKGEGEAEGEGDDDGPDSSNQKPKQKARMLKCECKECGYIVRTARRWLDEVGAPHCPNHGAMSVQDDDGKGD